MERQRAPPKGREAKNGSRVIDSRGRTPERLCRCNGRYAQKKGTEAAAGAGKESPPLVFHLTESLRACNACNYRAGGMGD